ncbi:MAG: DUF1573 domain-containing protein [Bacteroidales bacterium]|nr:DUF1573 domain-containing protein [Bacteroidales bacterium]MBD5372983.1 DUF1573 domain-containing protein [Bacteroides sp.]
MNRLLTSMALLLGAPLILSAQARWISQEHDFGAFSEDLGSVEAKFLLVNEADRPIRILEAQATCGCTVPYFTKDNIAPGDTASLTVTYLANGRPGKFSKNIYVKTSDAPSVRRTLTISGTVIGASATIRSRYPVDGGKIKLQTSTAGFGEVKRGKFKTVFISLYNQSPDSLKPELSDLPRYVQAQITPEVIAPGQQGQIALTLNSHEVPEWGITNADFTFRSAHGEDPVKMDLFTIIVEDFSRMTPGQMQNAPAAIVKPAKIDLGEISEPQTVEFTVTNEGKSPLIVRRLQVVDPVVTSAKISSEKIKPGKKATIKATIDPSLAENDFINARLSLITNDPNEPLNVVRITAEIKR